MIGKEELSNTNVKGTQYLQKKNIKNIFVMDTINDNYLL